MLDLARALDQLSYAVREFAGIQNPDSQFLTTEQVADRCKVHAQTVGTWCKMGLPYYTFGRGWKFLWSDVVAFLQTHRQTAPEAWRAK